MEQLLQIWRLCADKIQALSVRERVGVLLVGWVLIIFPLYFWWIEPVIRHWQQAGQQIREQQLQQQQSEAALRVLQARLQQDPNQALQQEIFAVSNQLTQMDDLLAKQTAGMIPADRMAETLRQMLVSSGKLKLQALVSLAPTPLLPKENKVNYYRHGVRLRLQGSYSDIYDYLQLLEQLPRHFYWQSLHYQVGKYPQGTVELILYTLGDSKEFIRG